MPPTAFPDGFFTGECPFPMCTRRRLGFANTIRTRRVRELDVGISTRVLIRGVSCSRATRHASCLWCDFFGRLLADREPTRNFLRPDGAVLVGAPQGSRSLTGVGLPAKKTFRPGVEVSYDAHQHKYRYKLTADVLQIYL